MPYPGPCGSQYPKLLCPNTGFSQGPPSGAGVGADCESHHCLWIETFTPGDASGLGTLLAPSFISLVA